MQGWIIDSYPNYDGDSMVVWLWTERGAQRIEDPRFRPSFFMSAPPSELQSYRQRLQILDKVGEVRETRRRLNLGDEESSPVLEIFPRHYADLNGLARTIDSNGGYYDHRLYNVDLRFSQRYFLQHDIFPLGLVDYGHNMWRMQEEQLALEYRLPPLRAALLDIAVDAPMGIPRLQDKLLGARLCEIDIGGSESEILEKLNAALRDLDPDVILTDGGDSFLMPYLARRSEALGVELQFGRDPQKLGEKKGKSYFTYGRIVYKPGQYLLKGRLHIDRGHFAYRESEMAGLGELSRLSTIVPQEQARLTPGTAFTAMQINRATKDGVLVMWKKNLPEFFKDAEQLIRADRGGFILEPEVGVHENIVELDYASLYPNIMVKFNLSMETLNCGCCADGGGQPVPGLGYHSCVRRLGLVPRILRPLIDRKRYYKKLKKEPGPKQEIYRERDTILKWTLVTCLDGSSMIPHYHGGVYRIAPIRDIIDPILPNGGVCESRDDLSLFSIDEDYKIVEKKASKLMKASAPPKMLSIKFSRGRSAVVTPNHRFHVLGKYGLETVVAEDLQAGQWVPIGLRLPIRRKPMREVNVIKGLLEAGFSSNDLQCWRIKGEILKNVIRENYSSVLAEALRQNYTPQAVQHWPRDGLIPLSFLNLLKLDDSQLDSLNIGRTFRHGGAITFLPARVEVDANLAFLLGFYIADGSGTGNMLRLYIGMDEQEIVGKLMDYVHHTFGLIGQVRKEIHANMLVLQFNSSALVKIMKHVFHVGASSDKGKLVVPEIILNGPEGVKYGFLAGLLAGDGSIRPHRDWACIATSNLSFAHAVGSLLSTLGIDFGINVNRGSPNPLYAVEVKLSDLQDRIWWADKRLKRLEYRASGQFRNHREIPLRASGLFDLAIRYHSSHSLSRKENAFIPRERLWKKSRALESRIEGTDRRVLENLKKLAMGEVTFVKVLKVEETEPRDRWIYCFEVEGEPNVFICNGNLVVGNSFGFQGFRNARFGRIECHESINAHARDLLVRSMEIAEQHGYEVVHGIVDSLWLRAKPSASGIDKLVEHINGAIGIPIDLEGVYKWVVFLPCKTTGVGALNRYYGLFQNGEMKLRGIELRKHDTSPFVNGAQKAMLNELSHANDAKEFMERLPRAVAVLQAYAQRLKDGKVPLQDLVLTKAVSRQLDEYTVMTSSVAALKQMKNRGYPIEPGEYIRFVITDGQSRDSERKVRVADFIQGDEKPDVKEYLKLLCRAGETLLLPFGYTEGKLLEACSKDSPPFEITVRETSQADNVPRRGGVGYIPTRH